MNWKKQILRMCIFTFVLLNITLFTHAAEFGKPGKGELPGALPAELVQILYGTPSVQLPSWVQIKERLQDLGFQDFADKSTFIWELAGQKKFPNEVVVIVRENIVKYAKTSGNPNLATCLTIWESDIVRALLADHPQAIKALEEQNWIKKRPVEEKKAGMCSIL